VPHAHTLTQAFVFILRCIADGYVGDFECGVGGDVMSHCSDIRPAQQDNDDDYYSYDGKLILHCMLYAMFR
jgi:hypothetical protein